MAALNAQLANGLRLLVLSNDRHSPAAVAGLLRERGFGPSRISVLEHLGGPLERRIDGTADDWQDPAIADLNLLAIDCRASLDAPRLSRLAGLPDSAFAHDGQLTKRDVRAMTLARLAPMPGELLWDVGAGSGSIGIEWMRAHPSCRALAIEADAGRQQLIEHNRDTLGVPGLHLIRGSAPQALAGLERPDAIFIGGGVTRDGVLATCWERLKPGGRLVANAVTLQSEMTLMDWRQRHGGELTRIHVAQAQPLGSSTPGARLCPSPCWNCTNPRTQSARYPGTCPMREETAEQPAPLRSGLTTGSCATATSLAAARLLLGNVEADAVDIVLPKGKRCGCAWSSAGAPATGPRPGPSRMPATTRT